MSKKKAKLGLKFIRVVIQVVDTKVNAKEIDRLMETLPSSLRFERNGLNVVKVESVTVDHMFQHELKGEQNEQTRAT